VKGVKTVQTVDIMHNASPLKSFEALAEETPKADDSHLSSDIPRAIAAGGEVRSVANAKAAAVQYKSF
jgi:hypothetical protein